MGGKKKEKEKKEKERGKRNLFLLLHFPFFSILKGVFEARNSLTFRGEKEKRKKKKDQRVRWTNLGISGDTFSFFATSFSTRFGHRRLASLVYAIHGWSDFFFTSKLCLFFSRAIFVENRASKNLCSVYGKPRPRTIICYSFLLYVRFSSESRKKNASQAERNRDRYMIFQRRKFIPKNDSAIFSR